MPNNFVYLLDGKIYVNLTNFCTADCLFCLRTVKDDVSGLNLWLDEDNVEIREVIYQLQAIMPENYDKEIVFCGYGEPLIKLEELLGVASYIKENYPNLKIRINTNGHANLVHKRNIVPELKGLIDEVSVSLNAENEQLYNEISRPKIIGAYDAVKDFAKKCVENGIDTTMTVVTDYKDFKIDIDECKTIAQKTGAKFRARTWLDNGY